MRYRLVDIINSDVQAQRNDGKWLPSRPINYRFQPLWWRVRDAWAVFTGRCDALDWGDRDGGEDG